jgi:hypothetical protein
MTLQNTQGTYCTGYDHPAESPPLLEIAKLGLFSLVYLVEFNSQGLNLAQKSCAEMWLQCFRNCSPHGVYGDSMKHCLRTPWRRVGECKVLRLWFMNTESHFVTHMAEVESGFPHNDKQPDGIL